MSALNHTSQFGRYRSLLYQVETAVAQWLRCCATNGRSLVQSQLVLLEFFIDIKSFRSHNGPGVDSACNRNRRISWGKGGRCIKLTTLPPSCVVVMKSGNLKFLEPSGPLQACNGSTNLYLLLYQVKLIYKLYDIVIKLLIWLCLNQWIMPVAIFL